MKRLLLVAVLGALIVGATGCDLSPPAATVNGEAISQSTLNAAVATEVGTGSRVSNAQCATELASGMAGSPVGVGTEGDGTTPNAVTPAFADNILESLVLEKLERQTLAERGVAVTAADVSNASTDYQGQLQGQLTEAQTQSTTPSGCTLTANGKLGSQLPGAFLARQAQSLAAQEVFEESLAHLNLSQSALEAYYQAHLVQVTEMCLNVIVSDTQAGAQSVHDLIAGGASFATASTSSGADAQRSPSGGALPCEYPATVTGQLGATLEATVDALSAGQLAEPLAYPVSGTTGTTTFYLTVQMREHVQVPFATVRSAIRQAILTAHVATVGAMLNKLVGRAHVTVDSRYGTWSAKKGVTVPVPPEPAFVLNAKANVPAAAATPGLHLNLPTG